MLCVMNIPRLLKTKLGSTQLEGVDVDETFSLKKYATEIFEKAHMVSCNPSRTHVDTESKLGVDGDPVSDPSLYRSLAEPHLSALKMILRYVQSTLNYGLQLFSSSITDLVAYSDADWAQYRGVANVVAETCWLRNLLLQHQRTKHIEIDIHFVCGLVVAGQEKQGINAFRIDFQGMGKSIAQCILKRKTMPFDFCGQID
nr:ribonuclease H-like domain-containing protein [Tanacetum cinerariifolium]